MNQSHWEPTVGHRLWSELFCPKIDRKMAQACLKYVPVIEKYYFYVLEKKADIQKNYS